MNNQKIWSKLDFVVQILLNLDNLEYSSEEKRFTGNIPDSSSLTYDEIINICHKFYIDTDDSSQENNQIVFDIVNTDVYFSIDDYLLNPERRKQVKPEKSFYIYETKFYYDYDVGFVDNDKPNFIKVAELFDALLAISDFQGANGNEPFIVFFGKNNLKISFNYNASDSNINLKKLELFIENYIYSDIHHEDKVLSVRNALHETFNQKNINFSDFLIKFEDFYKVVRNNFQLYIDKFSFDDFKNKVEEERRDYTIKINKVFSDMQNQLLSLPIATVLAAGQMVIVSNTGDFIKNTLIVVGITFFCVFVLMQISNQKETLDAINDEIELKESDMEVRGESEYKTKFLEVYSGLDIRINKLDRNLSLVKHITIVATVLVYLVFIARFYF